MNTNQGRQVVAVEPVLEMLDSEVEGITKFAISIYGEADEDIHMSVPTCLLTQESRNEAIDEGHPFDVPVSLPDKWGSYQCIHTNFSVFSLEEGNRVVLQITDEDLFDDKSMCRKLLELALRACGYQLSAAATYIAPMDKEDDVVRGGIMNLWVHKKDVVVSVTPYCGHLTL